MAILVTGGCGFIGSHTCVELLNAGYDVVICDDLSNSKAVVVDRIQAITGKRPAFYNIDIKDKDALTYVFDIEMIEAVIHFAGFKAVGESVVKPIEYYQNNLIGTLTLVDVMREHDCKKLVFSSSATVYGDPAFVPITESCPLGETTNPYGTTKAWQERIFKDIYFADNSWQIVLLRYFNPIGAHESGLIGEDPKGIPNNLVPYVAQTALGIRECLHIFGNDYPTPDGTCIRDYIHVVDLAIGHIKAIEAMDRLNGISIFNLGTGKGSSVLDVVNAYSKACGKDIPYVFDARRPGDVTTCYADPSLAAEILGWKAERTLEQMCADSFRWQSMNPTGYPD
ncbi:MAG: UDP-glucose 4-epimerase GalE [Lachnospiraceae bacterium]|nr:UDP-glucose 4-epimerase GalE [Lachnospiraceae bacterium]